ncbi:MAG: acyl-ACP--UDP-N-acetylglucosamine O-acyltransferase [Simkaniaceae bacterium]
MSKTKIHPSAIIESGAQIGNNVTIEPYAIIKGNVVLEDHVIIKSHAYIDGNTTIGEGTVVYPSASIGTKTQDKKFKGETTYVKIGKNCEIREFVTINSSCHENSEVKIEDDCLIMAYCHVAHNCKVGKGVIMSNGAMLAGHVTIEDHVVIGGMTPVHQFVRIGEYAMVGGFSRITHDIPPYTIGAGAPYKLGGLNLIGLKRHKFSMEVRKELTKAFKLTYRSGYHLEKALDSIEKEIRPSLFIDHWLNFCRTSKRGLIGFENAEQSSKDQLELELEECSKT